MKKYSIRFKELGEKALISPGSLDLKNESSTTSRYVMGQDESSLHE